MAVAINSPVPRVVALSGSLPDRPPASERPGVGRLAERSRHDIEAVGPAKGAQSALPTVAERELMGGPAGGSGTRSHGAGDLVGVEAPPELVRGGEQPPRDLTPQKADQGAGAATPR
jgi:hypothetical protein